MNSRSWSTVDDESCLVCMARQRQAIAWLEKNWLPVHKVHIRKAGFRLVFVFAGDTGKSLTVFSKALRTMSIRR
jgi:hypothetical protein